MKGAWILRKVDMVEGFEEWSVAKTLQPRQEDFPFDLDWTLSSTVSLRAVIPPDAFTANLLGTLRIGHGAVIGEDLVLTIGYLVTEAEEIWLQTHEGRVVAGHVLGVDTATGFGLVRALDSLGVPVLKIGDSHEVMVGDRVIAGGGAPRRSVSGRLVARQEFAGYWEYVLDEALFTAPAHPMWSGTALIGPTGKLVGIGSLQMQQQGPGGKAEPINMMVPIELLPPILDDLLAGGGDLPARPWLGLLAEEISGRVVIIGANKNGPAERADLTQGDIIIAVKGEEVNTLADFYRAVWALGPAGVGVPLTLAREGDVFEVEVRSKDRRAFLKRPKMH
jgi:S1-C subfamily serine protease